MIQTIKKKKKSFHRLEKRLSAIILIFIFFGIVFNILSNSSLINKNLSHHIDKNPKLSFLWATLDMTNPGEVNNTQFYHSTVISVEGRIYNRIDNSSKQSINVAIEVDDVVDMSYTDATDPQGRFDINYIVDPFLDIYSSHKIEVFVTDVEPGGPGSEIEYHHFYTIFVNATSYFDIPSYDDPTIPKLTGEDFSLDGFLRYDNGNGISSEIVNFYWFEGATIISQGSYPTEVLGSLSNNLTIPVTLASQLTLKFNYSNPPFVEYSQIFIVNIKIFSNVAWNVVYDNNPTAGGLYTLSGTLSSFTDPSLKLSNRNVDVYFNGSFEVTVTTRTDGSFTSSFTLPPQNGTVPIELEMENSAGKILTSGPQDVLVKNRPAGSGGGGPTLPPMLVFSLIFFPILIGIVVGLAVYGFFFYKKQEAESRVVNIPLESKIINLKILKDTGRLEESLSYLFNAIYMDLVNAKYNRTRNENETIRDFAIISVKELKLTPSSIYPFIQQVEEIIYGKPFNITEKDFYKTVDLFSPIYFQLTGHNFVLNF
ncbi:hypothetical protein LCGC14_0710320 [marine sediment metagenome]|uniref:DUF4129 domain-containing protein n=1 Tax=marine sediment metagenome TaxID=412755 RepID=A0A0F9QJS3_9ZZZZ